MAMLNFIVIIVTSSRKLSVLHQFDSVAPFTPWAIFTFCRGIAETKADSCVCIISHERVLPSEGKLQ